ncbi:endonuclease III domain-containing protein [Austwickia chelonae]|uniref:endonuclease III domain-containing protein n=1 Tax=Austwickia chelonae TaxID=100225 RepID=UPI001F0817D9|nr:deoxyribonuclease [Austwickia chelonae]
MDGVPLRSLYELLRAATVKGEWWPAETRFEIFVGAVLTQNVSWINVGYSLAKLRTARLLDAEPLANADPTVLRELIRPSGYMRAKSRCLIDTANWYLATDDLTHGYSDEELRASLLEVKGIGPETADDILLYAYRRPVFIWDIYARRLLAAAGHEVPSSYESTRRQLGHLVTDGGFTTEQLAEFHGFIVDAGKQARRAGGWEAYLRTLRCSTSRISSEQPARPVSS